MDLSSKKVVMVIAPENFRDEEYFHTKESIEKKGAIVDTASLQKTAISGIEKKEVEVDLLLNDIGDEYDAIVFVGGGGAKIYFQNEKAQQLARKYYDDGKVVAAICIAPLILAHAGILKDKKATVWDGSHSDLIDFGANYTAKDVEADGNIITANGPRASYKFGKMIAKALK